MTTHPKIRVSDIPAILDLSSTTGITPFFLSNPGIGKTQQVEHYAKRHKADLTVLVASLLDRSDFQLPVLDKEKESVRLVPLDQMKDLSVEYKPQGPPTVLYWNEYNSAPETLHPVLYRLIN